MELLTAALVTCGPIGAAALGAVVRAARQERRRLASAADWLASGMPEKVRAQLQSVGRG